MSVRAKMCFCLRHVARALIPALSLIPAITLFLFSCTPIDGSDNKKLHWPANFHVQLSDNPETLLTMQSFSSRHQTGFNLLLEVWSDESGETLIKTGLKARSARWDEKEELWELKDVYLVRDYDGANEVSKSFKRLDTVLGFSLDDLKRKVAENRHAR